MFQSNFNQIGSFETVLLRGFSRVKRGSGPNYKPCYCGVRAMWGRVMRGITVFSTKIFLIDSNT